MTSEQSVEYVSYEYDGKCWWCGAEADSREHKFPRALIELEFGKASTWDESGGVSHVVAGNEARLNGPGSKRMTFQKVMCRKCNNERSAPYDRAIIEWAKFIKANESSILARARYSQADIWSNWRAGRVNFAAFLVKHVACHLAQVSVEVPRAIIDFLDGKANFPHRHLALNLGIRQDIADFLGYATTSGEPQEERSGALWLGEVGASISKSRQAITEVYGHFTFRWIRVNWVYSVEPVKGGLNFGRKVVRLKRERNIPESDLAAQLHSIDSEYR